ncbi:unnamed protein product, partial [Brugia pahangi]|uniref:BAR domain-containing protein n=1 Tax=Brugia pahangi TaxID=6280 RepID=A0A0N4SYH3_BRUPA
ARKSVERQNEVNIAIEAEFSNFSSEINREFNERDYKNRIEFLKSMCQHYTDNLSHRMNELAFDEMEIWQKLNKLEWDIIILQCVGRSLIEASTSYLSEIYFDNIEQTLHKTKKNLTQIDNIVANNYNLSIAYGINLSPVPSAFASEISVDDNKVNVSPVWKETVH